MVLYPLSVRFFLFQYSTDRLCMTAKKDLSKQILSWSR